METCPFCRAAVADLGWHYGGYKCAPCVDVLLAFGPDDQVNYNRRGDPMLDDAYPLPGAYAPRGQFGKNQTRAEKLKRQRAWQGRKRRTPAHAGVRL